MRFSFTLGLILATIFSVSFSIVAVSNWAGWEHQDKFLFYLSIAIVGAALGFMPDKFKKKSRKEHVLERDGCCMTCESCGAILNDSPHPWKKYDEMISSKKCGVCSHNCFFHFAYPLPVAIPDPEMQQRFYLYTPGDGTLAVCYQQQPIGAREPTLEEVAYFINQEARKKAKATDRPKLRYVLDTVSDRQWTAIRPFKRIGPNHIDDLSHADYPPYSIEINGDTFVYEDRTPITDNSLLAAIRYYLANEERVDHLVKEQLP